MAHCRHPPIAWIRPAKWIVRCANSNDRPNRRESVAFVERACGGLASTERPGPARFSELGRHGGHAGTRHSGHAGAPIQAEEMVPSGASLVPP